MSALEGRIALVTGGGRGIGSAISRALASAGAFVAVNYRHDEKSAEATVEQIRSTGGKAKAFQASIDELSQCESLAERVVKEMGPPSILINNAGIASRGLTVAETPPKELNRLLQTHVVSAHTLCRLLIPGMRNVVRADILMISCASADEHIATGAPYTMAKASLEVLARTLAKEEREHGIRVNIVSPGLVNTEIGRRLMRARAGILKLSDLDDVSPFGHVCQPEEIGDVVKFLVSPSNSYMTGAKIICNGGGTVDHDWY